MTTHLMMTIEGFTGILVPDEYSRLARFSPALLELVASLVTRTRDRTIDAVTREYEEAAADEEEDRRAAEEEEAEEDDDEDDEEDEAEVTCPDCGALFAVTLSTTPDETETA